MSRYLRLFRDDPENSRTFPTPIEPASDDSGVGWKLRYAPASMTREDQMYAASVLNAYAYLICEMTAKDRQSVVSEIRRLLASGDCDRLSAPESHEPGPGGVSGAELGGGAL